ncbi:MAG: phosphonate metabolism transcriptional regulator PhnF [Hyphomicrobiales bacterium]
MSAKSGGASPIERHDPRRGPPKQVGLHGWREVEQRVRNAIDRREFDVGQRIPTETELMATFGSSRYAIRRALDSLQRQGLIRIEQGRGTFVHENYLVSYRLGDRARFTEVLLEDQITPGNEVLGVSRTKATSLVARFLGVPVGRSVLFLENLGYANGQVVKHDASYFPLPRFEGIETVLKRESSVTAALAAHGVADYRRKSTSIVGRLPSPSEARLLRQLPSNPIFEVVRLDVDENDRPILFGITTFSCERVRFTLGQK